MAIEVTKTLLKILMSFIPIFIAFTLTFNILMQSSEIFQSTKNTGLKVFVMMLGEFEFTDYFTTHEVSKVGGRNISVQLLFVLFVIYVCVIVVNLLIGLTVNDINDLKKKGSNILASMQIHDIVDMKRKIDFPCYKFIFVICSPLRPQELMEQFTKKNTKDQKDKMDKKVTPKKVCKKPYCKSSYFKNNQQLPDYTLQVCIKLDPSNQSKKTKSRKSIISTFLIPDNLNPEPGQQLYFYDNDKLYFCDNDEFPGELPQEIIQHARETLRIYKIEKQDFNEKLSAIREKSNFRYNKIVNQRNFSTDVNDTEDNLAKLAKLVKDLIIKN